MKNKIGSNFLFLSPFATIRYNHLSKKDVATIKGNLLRNTILIYFVIAILIVIMNIVILTSMYINSNGQIISKYGVSSFIGQLVATFGCSIYVLFIIFSLKIKNTDFRLTLLRIASDILFIVVFIDCIFSLHADALMGYTTQGESLSASTLLFAILILIQPVYWIDAVVLDGSVSITTLVVSISLVQKYDMKGLLYYILICVGFPIAAYIVKSVLFYAEAQKYCQEIKNEMLYNTAIYDEVTKCKNRFALKEFVNNNEKRWKSRPINLLVIMFDIDDFKLYNDQFSHPGGDYCLRTISESIRKAFPTPNLDFYRYGGEEFLLFFEMRNIEDCPSILKRINSAVRKEQINAPNGAPKEIVTVSVGGLFVITNENFSYDEALKQVDSYMYMAKRNGKDSACLNGKILN